MAKQVAKPISSTHPQRMHLFFNSEEAYLYTASSGRKTFFICEKGHKWKATIFNVIKNGTGCPYCAGKRVLPGFNDIATTHPDCVYLFADPEDSLKYTAGSRSRVKFLCKENHEWEAPISRVIGGGTRCKICAGQVTLPGFNDIATTHPHLVSLFSNPEEAYLYTAGSQRKTFFLCEKGHSWKSAISHVIGRGTGCIYCANTKVLPGFNDIATIHPNLVQYFKFLEEATHTLPGSAKKVSLICPLKHEWDSPAYRVTRDPSIHHCPYCSGMRVLPGFNDVLTTHPNRAKLFVNPEDATRYTFSSAKIATFGCGLPGHVWNSRVCAVIPFSTECSVCSGRTVIAGVNDVATTHPDRVFLFANPKNATHYSAGSQSRCHFRCTCGHAWTTAVNEVVSKGSGCSVCSATGFNVEKPAHFYLIPATFDKGEVIQFGISNKIAKRLAEHRRSGFNQPPLKTITGQGQSIRDLETKIKRMMKTLGIKSVHTQGLQFKSRGATEAFFLNDDSRSFLTYIIEQMNIYEEKSLSGLTV